MATRIGPLAGHRTQVDDARPGAVGDQPRQQQARAVEQALDVGVDHGVPVVQVAGLRRVGAQRQAGVVDQAAQGGELFRQVVHGRAHRRAVAHVQGQRQHPGLRRKLTGQGLQTLLATAGEHQRPAGLGETTGAGFAEA